MMVHKLFIIYVWGILKSKLVVPGKAWQPEIEKCVKEQDKDVLIQEQA